MQGFFGLRWFYSKQIWKEFLQDVSGYAADGCVAGDFTKLVSTHAVRNDVEAEWKAACVSSQRRSDCQQAILVQVALLAGRLTNAGNQLLDVEVGSLAVHDGLDLFVSERCSGRCVGYLGRLFKKLSEKIH